MLMGRILAALCLGALVVVFAAPAASAATYIVTANPYTATHSLSVTDSWDSYEITASTGSKISYSVAVTETGCVKLALVQGHGVTLDSQYYIDYSQETCVASYSNTFPVESGEGTDFSVVIMTSMMTGVNYTISISTAAPAGLDPLVVLAVLLPILAVVIVVVVLVARRRKRAVPMAPPPYVPAWPPQPPQAPMGLPPQPTQPAEQPPGLPPQPPQTPP